MRLNVIAYYRQRRGVALVTATVKRVRTSVLEIAYEENGPADAAPVLLMHGWPYDPRVYDDVVPRLVAANCRTIAPYLRGFGATRFLSPATPRSGQQAALANDLKEFMDALGLKRAALVGYDWGWARGLHCRCALAGARAILGHRQWLQHPRHSQGQ